MIGIDFNPDGRLLLAAAGWADASWCENYYPGDLPVDWRLDYFANDFDCAVIQAVDWRADPAALAASLVEAPDDLHCLVHGAGEADAALWHALDGRPAIALGDTHTGNRPCWSADSDDSWRAPGGVGRVVRWRIEEMDLRRLRERVSDLPADTVAVWLDGAGFDPSRVGELRTLLQLLGRD